MIGFDNLTLAVLGVLVGGLSLVAMAHLQVWVDGHESVPTLLRSEQAERCSP